MSILDNLKPLFHNAFPRLASGKQVHFMTVRQSQSLPIFQTDGVLNTAKTNSGIETESHINRIMILKRKQISPERLTGRELLRERKIISSEKDSEYFCRYGGENFCGKCPDCVIYGFAVGDSGSERSKLYSDSAFSLTSYENSHKSFTFNSLSEAGTMIKDSDDPSKTKQKQNRHSINELDHVIPEIAFPTVETLHDSTHEGFIYVLGNILRTRRYGAQASRTGTVKNHLVGITFCDGEIFSNLYFTQALYDELKANLNPPPPINQICRTAEKVAENLLEREPVRKEKMIFGDELQSLLTEVSAIYQDEAKLTKIISTLSEQTTTYATTYGSEAFPQTKKSKPKET